MSITKYIRDQELFKTGLNISELIRKIIINYHSKYKDDINELKNKIKDADKNETRNQQFNEDEYLNIAWKITKYLCQSFNRFLIISLDVLICRYSPLLRAFPALFISEEPHKSFYYPSCFHSQK